MRSRLSLIALSLIAAISLPSLAIAATPAQIAAGQKIAETTTLGNCDACHNFQGASEAGNIGPALHHVKSMMPNRKVFYAIIYNEEARNPQTVMPAFGKNHILTPQQINDVIDFMYTK